MVPQTFLQIAKAALRRGDHFSGSFALSMRSRTHGAPPRRANFSFWAGFIFTMTGTIASPSGSGLRPCPRPGPPWPVIFFSMMFMVNPKTIQCKHPLGLTSCVYRREFEGAQLLHLVVLGAAGRVAGHMSAKQWP